MRKILLAISILVVISTAFIPAHAGERAAINAGAIKTELWHNGLMGDTTASLLFPAGLYQGASLLRLGSLWFGGSVDGKQNFGVSCGDITTSGQAVSEWTPDSLGVQVFVPGSRAPLELKLNLTDDDPAANKGINLGITASVKAHQWSYLPVDKLYLLEYSFRNDGAAQIDSAYAGLWHLGNVFKTQAINTENIDYTGYDVNVDPLNGTVRNMLYVAADSVQCQNTFGVSSPYIGFRLLHAVNPNGSPAVLSGACSWRGASNSPQSDASLLDYRSRYFYLSRGKFDAELIPRFNVPKLTIDNTHLRIDGKVLTEVDGVWDVNDTSHIGQNYYIGGIFNASSGIITLGTPKADKLKLVAKEQDSELDTLTVQTQNLPLAQVTGVYDNATGTGTNYYSGGSFVSATGVITLGTPYVKLNTVSHEEDWASDDYTLYAQITPLYQVISVYDNPADTGTEYYAGGTFNESSGQITLGTAYANYGSAPLYVNYKWREASPFLYVDYSYKLNNVVTSYKYYHTKTGVVPTDYTNLTISDPTGLEEVAGVYRQSDTLMSGTDYYIGGSFDKGTGQIMLATPLPDDTADYYLRENYMLDMVGTPNDSFIWLGIGIWPDYDKVVEIVGIYDNSSGTGTDYFAGGSYDPVTDLITLGTPFDGGDMMSPVFITYRYLKLTNALVKYHSNDLGSQNVMLSVGPWNMSPGDSAKAVFAVVAGNSLAELQATSDSALYIWNNPGAAVTTTKGSVSGQVARTLGRGMVENAVVTAYQGPTPIDSGITDGTGRYFVANLEAGAYDSLVATSTGYLQSAILFNADITAGQDTTGLDFVLTSVNAGLSGYVFRSDSSTAVAGALVFLQGVNYDSTFTDIGGYYSFKSVLTSTTDSLLFSAPGCVAEVIANLNLQADSAMAVNKVLHSAGGWLDGRITKSDSLTPVANAIVSVTGPVSASDTTDASGNYSFTGLAAGTYDISITASGYAMQNISGMAVRSDSTTWADASLYQEFSSSGLVWAVKTKMPNWLFGSASCQLGGKVYVFGGRDYGLVKRAAYRYDPSADTLGGTPWAALADMPTARYGLGCAAVGDSIIYVIGGYTQDSIALSTIEAYIPNDNSWVTGLTGMPTPRAFMGVTSIKDSVYAVGGENNLIAGLDTVEIYLSSSNVWVTKKALFGGPAFGRSGAVVTALDSLGVKRIYATGGKKLDGTFLAVNQKYNPVTNTWGTRTALSSSVSYGAGAAVNDSLYLVGGKNGSGYLSGAYSYSPFSNTWLVNNAYHTGIAQASISSQDSMGFWVLGGMTNDGFISDSIYFGYKPGAIEGNVTIFGTPVTGVTVTALKGSQAKNSEQTKADGSYTLAGLEPGNYDVHFFKTGSVDSTIKNIQVKWGRITGGVNGVEGKPIVLEQYGFKLGLAYPNPVNNQTTISYQLPAKSNVELSVYNVLGQKIKVLAQGTQNPGWHSVIWNGRDNGGRKVSSGIYLYRLSSGSGSAVKKLVVIR
ncbi:carboxypeptidase regulatory-like domain-containing protein [candidate division TA06 bacterium]|nr:carboxypeptidase regulatory-like domain-containing protein [candidate division TA06 bacterium]